MLEAYASRTGTKRNLEALKNAGWGILISPFGVHDAPLGLRYMLDCGEWTRYQIAENERQQRAGLARPHGYRLPDWYGIENDDLETVRDHLFGELLEKFGAGADMIILPDRVASPLSLEISIYWIDAVAYYGRPMLIPVQNGMTPEDVRPHLGIRTFDIATLVERCRGITHEIEIPVGIFLGGDTEWKEATMMQWGTLARELGIPYHVGRVNTARRIKMAIEAGATSIDGSSASRYSKTLPELDLARRGVEWVRRGTNAGQILAFGQVAEPARPHAMETKSRQRQPEQRKSREKQKQKPEPVKQIELAEVDSRQLQLFRASV